MIRSYSDKLAECTCVANVGREIGAYCVAIMERSPMRKNKYIQYGHVFVSRSVSDILRPRMRQTGELILISSLTLFDGRKFRNYGAY